MKGERRETETGGNRLVWVPDVPLMFSAVILTGILSYQDRGILGIVVALLVLYGIFLVFRNVVPRTPLRRILGPPRR